MFDYTSIIELAKIEPGHGLLQSALLFMIWLSSRGLRKEIASLSHSLEVQKTSIEHRFERVEGRITVLEKTHGGF